MRQGECFAPLSSIYTESNYKMDAKREMGNSNFEIIIAKHETTVSNPGIRKKMMTDGLDMSWLSIGLMGQRISGQAGEGVVIAWR